MEEKSSDLKKSKFLNKKRVHINIYEFAAKYRKFVNDKKKLGRIIVIFLVFVIVIFFIVYCNSRKHIKLIYIAEAHYDDISRYAKYGFKAEYPFTWWEHFSSDDKEDIIEFIDKTYGTRFGDKWELNIDMIRQDMDDIDMDKQDIIISIGRKLKSVYYDEKIYPDGKDKEGMIIAVPVFEGYGTCEIYMYVTDKKYNIYPPELANDDIIEFNRFGNVRFEEE